VLRYSTREYLHDYSMSKGGIGQRYIDLGRHSIDAMSERLTQNTFDLDPGVKSKDIMVPKTPCVLCGTLASFGFKRLCEGESSI
jgi:hypothetical protein